MFHRCRVLLAFALIIALVALVPRSEIALAKGTGGALGKQMQRVANQLVSAIRGRKPLKGFMSKRVKVTYRTSDRSAGTFKGKVVVGAAKIDGTVAVPGLTGGQAWVPKQKKIKPRRKTMKLEVGKKAREVLEAIRESNRPELLTVDKKKLMLGMESSSESMSFRFRLAKDRTLRVYELGYSNEDPG